MKMNENVKVKTAYVDAEPVVPTYYATEWGIGRILKYTFDPIDMWSKGIVVQFTSGFCEMIDDTEGDCMDCFSPCPNHPNSISNHQFEWLIQRCDEPDIVLDDLEFWGITSIYFDNSYTKTCSINDALEMIFKEMDEKEEQEVANSTNSTSNP